jgi:hypothetical protein
MNATPLPFVLSRTDDVHQHLNRTRIICTQPVLNPLCKLGSWSSAGLLVEGGNMLFDNPSFGLILISNSRILRNPV